MSRSRCIWHGLLALTVVTLLASIPTVAQAHERRNVGRYEFVVGFIVEPAIEGLKNGVDLRVQVPGATPTPVEGVEKTLKVEVTHVPTGKSKTMNLRTIFRDPGHYTADLIPTAPGQYRFRFFGEIAGLKVDEQFTSGEHFDNIEPADELQFPERVAQVREVQGVARDAQAAADDANSAASTARALALAAIVIAVIAVAGTSALALRRR